MTDGNLFFNAKRKVQRLKQGEFKGFQAPLYKFKDFQQLE